MQPTTSLLVLYYIGMIQTFLFPAFFFFRVRLEVEFQELYFTSSKKIGFLTSPVFDRVKLELSHRM